jgi:hypothetical protein
MAETQPKKGGYGKRPLWQWILFYVIVAGVVYFAIAYFFLNGHSAGGGGSTLPGY